MTTIQLDLPAHWATYLVNGDTSGMDPIDLQQANACLMREDVGPCIDCSADQFFTRSHDALAEDVLPCMCLTYTFVVAA